MNFKGFDISEFTCTMEYTLPISRKYITENLTPENEVYKDNYIEYIIPLTSRLTEENGNIDLQLTFTKVDLNDEGKKVNYVIKTKTTSISITPITNWSDIIPDESLTALDNRLLAIDGQIKAINELQGSINSSIPDDLTLTDDLLQLTHKGEAVGEGVKIFVVDEDYVSNDVADGNHDGVLDIDTIVETVEMGG
jgi:hypothetical protein